MRPYKKGDEADIVKHAHDKTIAKNTLVMPYPYTMKDASAWIKKNLAEYNKKDSKNFVLA